jgi:sugar/nucleoside kinase (ribokinase family)
VDVCGIGSALVDVLVEVTPDQVEACHLIKGSMQLMDLAASEAIHAQLPAGIERSGGSCANTIAGLGALGGSVGFIGRVADDRLGKVFADGLDELGVAFDRSVGGAGEGTTGRCLILVTPDADRTMCTTLGVAAHLGASHLHTELIRTAEITYLEGYLWDEPVAIDALRTAISVAHDAGRRVALTLSDPFCVERHRDEWVEVIARDVDIVFGNEAEVCAISQASTLDEACTSIRREGLTVTVTRGAHGAIAFAGRGPIVSAPAAPVARVVDTTGAGDLYAAGFLCALTRGRDLETCIRVGAVAAAEVISHVGARPESDLVALAAPILR